MSRTVLRLAPKIYEDNSTMNDLYTVQAEEMESLQSGIKNAICNNYIHKSNEHGIEMWEKTLNFYPKDVSLEERRKMCMMIMSLSHGFTMTSVKNVLDILIGKDKYVFYVKADDLVAVIDADTPFEYEYFKSFIKRFFPSNIRLIFSIPYTYMYLNKFYYKTLTENGYYVGSDIQYYTYAELSKYATEDVYVAFTVKHVLVCGHTSEPVDDLIESEVRYIPVGYTAFAYPKTEGEYSEYKLSKILLNDIDTKNFNRIKITNAKNTPYTCEFRYTKPVSVCVNVYDMIEVSMSSWNEIKANALDSSSLEWTEVTE